MKFIFILLAIFVTNNCVFAQSKIYALVVGVSDYRYDQTLQGLNDLQYSDDDARAMQQYFRLNGHEVTLLTDTQASKNNILETASKLYSKATAQDEIIFFFSGHGVEGGFVPHDFDGTNFLLHSEIKALFKNSAAKIKICIADACHAGSIKQKARNRELENSSETSTEKAIQIAEVVIMMSSRGSESSEEHPTLQKGVFTHYLLQGFFGQADKNNDRKITITELFNYLSSQVSSFTKQKQHPVIFGKFDVNMVVVGY